MRSQDVERCRGIVRSEHLGSGRVLAAVDEHVDATEHDRRRIVVLARNDLDGTGRSVDLADEEAEQSVERGSLRSCCRPRPLTIGRIEPVEYLQHWAVER